MTPRSLDSGQAFLGSVGLDRGDGAGQGQWGHERVSNGSTSQLEQENGPEPEQPTTALPAPSHSFLPSSLLCSVFPGSLSEAQVAKHPLAEGINTLN